MQLINGTTQLDRMLNFIDDNGYISRDVAMKKLGVSSKQSFSNLLCKIRNMGYKFSLKNEVYTVEGFKPRVEVKVVDTSYIRRRNLLIPKAELVANKSHRRQTVNWTRAFLTAMDDMAHKEFGVKTSTL